MKNTVRRLLAVIMVIGMVLSVSGSVFALETPDMTDIGTLEARSAKTYDLSGIRNGRTFDVDTQKVDEIAADQVVSIMVELEDAPAMEVYGQYRAAQNYAASLRAKQDVAVSKIQKALGVSVKVRHNYTLLFNGFSFKGEYRLVEELNKMEGIHAFVAEEWDCPEIQLFNSTDMVGAINAWDLDYTGAGHIVAIVDTGMMVDHPAFANDPEEVRFTRDDIAAFISGGELDGNGAATMTIDDVYYSAKVPFRWDYVYSENDVAHTYNDHGTHVAGIAAGNGGEIVGVAKDAQIAAMQVFKNTGGASWDDILPALEDCVVLGVDAANLSLGSPCGFTQYYDDSYAQVFQNLVNAGVNLSMSAGNEYSTALGNAWAATSNSIGYVLVENPDYGVTGSPSTWPESLGIASVDNSMELLNYIQIPGAEELYSYTENSSNVANLAATLGGSTVGFVAVPGYGTPADYEGIDVTGKIALVSRGDITFVEKGQNAQAAGAVACIVYNNTDGSINMATDASITIPFVFILKEYADAIIESGATELYIGEEPALIDAPGGGLPSAFSSWGTTSDLRIKPEITAPGGNIYSSTDPRPSMSGELYQSWSGTSMSAPHVTGGMAIVTAYVEDMFPDASAAERQGLVNAILMSTADPVVDEDGDFAAVRKQGAGLMDLASAVTTTSYLSVEGCSRPKLELGDDPEKTGVYEMTFTVNNFGETALTYTVEPHVLIDNIQAIAYAPDGGYVLAYTQTSLEITEDCDVEMPDSVTVPAGGTADVTVTVTLSDELADYLDAYYPTGAYVEGFIELYSEGGGMIGDVNNDGKVNSEDATLVMRYAMGIGELENLAAGDVNGDGEVNMADALLIFRYAMGVSTDFEITESAAGTDLNIPFLAFYGDWNYAPMFDFGFYYEDFAWNSNPQPNIVGAIYNNQYVIPLGLNPYVDTEDLSYYMDDRNAVSPNGDGFLDKVDYMTLGLLRNINDFQLQILDENGEELELLDYVDFNYRKDYCSTSTMQYSNFGTYLDPIDLSEYAGRDIFIRFYAGLSNDGSVTTNPFTRETENYFNEWIVPVHVDVIAPTIEFVSFEDGNLVVEATDDHYVSFVGAINDDGIVAMEGVFEEERGMTTEVTLEGISEGDYIVVADYAGIEHAYIFDGEGLVDAGDEPTPGPGPEPSDGSSIDPVDLYEGLEGYGGPNFLDDWYIVDDDGDGNNWGLAELPDGYTHLGYDGKYVFFSASYDNNTGALTPDNWLISCAFTPGEGEKYISFFTSAADAGYYREHLAVYVVPADFVDADNQTVGEISDYTAVGEFTLSSASLTEQLMSIGTQYAGQEIRIVIRHFNCTDEFRVFVDGIGVGNLK